MAVAAEMKRPRGAARREALLQAALRIVGEIGPDAVTHRRVAEVAGLPLASTTYWFSSKDELLAAALERAADTDLARLRQAAAGLDASNPVESIVALTLGPVGDELRTSRASLIAAYALWLEAARRPELRELSARWTDACHDAVANVLEQAGRFNPREDARLLVAAADGLMMDQLARGGSRDLRPPLRRLAAALLGQVSAQ